MKTNHTKSILERLFAHDFYKNTDTAALVKQHDISAQLRLAAAVKKPAVAPMVQTANIISSIPPQGIVITTAGQYQFANDITWTPANPGAAITIKADGVVLDLAGFTLQAAIGDVSSIYNGIEVCNADMVSVQNGTISGFTYYGVSASCSYLLDVSNITVNGLAYQNTQTALATPCGIFVNKAIDFLIQNCSVQNMNVTSASCAGIQVNKSVNGLVIGCNLNAFVNNDGAVQGFSYLMSSGVTTIGCSSSTFQSHYLGETLTSGHTVLGFCPILCVGLFFENCGASGMTGCCDDCHGMSVFLDADIVVSSFFASGVIDGVTPTNTGAKATGLEVYGVDVVINDCTVENITAIVPQDLQSAGFSACGANITFNNCQAQNVMVVNAQGQPDTSLGYGTGFGWAPDPRQIFIWPANNVTYNNCTATNCQLGFDTWNHTNSIWEPNISAPGCPTFMLIQPAGTQRVVSMDKCSESPNGQYQQVAITNIAANNVYPAGE